MLFRTIKGELIYIEKNNYQNDRDYYRTILERVYGVEFSINSLNNYLHIIMKKRVFTKKHYMRDGMLTSVWGPVFGITFM